MMLEHFMSLALWIRVVVEVIGYVIVSFGGLIYASAHNQTTEDYKDNIKDDWIIAWVLIWPLVSLWYPISKIIEKGFLQRWLYEAPVLFIANIIRESRKKKVEKHKVPEKDFHVKNDWRD